MHVFVMVMGTIILTDNFCFLSMALVYIFRWHGGGLEKIGLKSAFSIVLCAIVMD